MSNKTPEVKVKEKIDDVLNAYAPHVWYRKIVTNGMGKPVLDYTGCCCGDFFSIEAKAEWKDLSPQQANTWKEIEDSGGQVFKVRAIDDEQALNEIDNWIHMRVMQRKRRIQSLQDKFK